jgi:hypothetical protein
MIWTALETQQRQRYGNEPDVWPYIPLIQTCTLNGPCAMRDSLNDIGLKTRSYHEELTSLLRGALEKVNPPSSSFHIVWSRIFRHRDIIASRKRVSAAGEF